MGETFIWQKQQLEGIRSGPLQYPVVIDCTSDITYHARFFSRTAPGGNDANLACPRFIGKKTQTNHFGAGDPHTLAEMRADD